MVEISGEPRWLTARQQRSWRSLVTATTLLFDRLDAELRREHDLSLTEYEILVRLSERPEHALRMAQLADALGHSRSRVTHTVARMEAAGWVRRTTSPDDGRGIVCGMTPAGQALLETAARTHVRGVREYLVDLATEADFATVGRVMDEVADRLVGDRPEVEIRLPRN